MLPPTSRLHLGHLHLTAEIPMQNSYRKYRIYGLPASKLVLQYHIFSAKYKTSVHYGTLLEYD